MAYVYKRAEKWYIGYRDNRGKWRGQACSARTKTEAKRMADELGLNHERQRLGMEALPAQDGGGTFGALLRWWLKTYSAESPSHDRNRSTMRSTSSAPRSRSYDCRTSHRPSWRCSSKRRRASSPRRP